MAFGFVLVGGRSRRMGRDKALLLHQGTPLAEHQAEKLAFVCGRAALVGKEGAAFSGLPYPFVSDNAETHASIYGVLAALEWSPEDSNLVLAVDLPLCPASFLGALLELAEGEDAPAVVPVAGGFRQPLCAVYRKRLLKPFRDRLVEGDLSLVGALRSREALFLSEERTASLPGFDPSIFVNVNTPEDYLALEQETGPAHPPRR